MAEAPQHDHVIRALTDDGSFRVMVARSTELCATAVQKQGVEGDTARRFGALLTGTVLVRETMAPDLRVQGIVKGSNHTGTLVADSRPEGGTRGLVQSRGGDLELGGDALMQFMRTLPNGAVHRGVVKVPDDGGVDGALMAYMQESEQIFTVMATHTALNDDGSVRSAGGYVVQLLPGADSSVLAVVTERLRDFADLAPFVDKPDYDPDQLLEELLYRMPFARIETRPVRFECPCDEATVLGSLATLDPKEIASLVEAGEVLEIACDYCKSDYAIAPDQLRGLLQSS